jgi:hypothetical protein
MSEPWGFLHTMPWFAWVAIVAIVSGAVTQVIGQSQRHAERMAMIRAGMNPNLAADQKPAVGQEI